MKDYRRVISSGRCVGRDPLGSGRGPRGVSWLTHQQSQLAIQPASRQENRLGRSVARDGDRAALVRRVERSGGWGPVEDNGQRR